MSLVGLWSKRVWEGYKLNVVEIDIEDCFEKIKDLKFYGNIRDYFYTINDELYTDSMNANIIFIAFAIVTNQSILSSMKIFTLEPFQDYYNFRGFLRKTVKPNKVLYYPSKISKTPVCVSLC